MRRNAVGWALLLSLCLSCLGVPPAPSGLAALVDLPDSLPRGPVASLEFEAEGDAAWARRDTAGMAEAARLAYWKAASADPERDTAYWKAARASSLVGRQARDKEARADAFERGLQTTQLLLDRRPDLPEAHYYFATNLGLLARERPSRGHEAVKEMIPHLERVASDAPELEQGGAERALALVYLRAPGWPTSVGNPETGLQHALRSIEQAPDYPGNHVALAEAWEANEDRERAQAALNRAAELIETGVWTRSERVTFLDDAESVARKLARRN